MWDQEIISKSKRVKMLDFFYIWYTCNVIFLKFQPSAIEALWMMAPPHNIPKQYNPSLNEIAKSSRLSLQNDENTNSWALHPEVGKTYWITDWPLPRKARLIPLKNVRMYNLTGHLTPIWSQKVKSWDLDRTVSCDLRLIFCRRELNVIFM